MMHDFQRKKQEEGAGVRSIMKKSKGKAEKRSWRKIKEERAG